MQHLICQQILVTAFLLVTWKSITYIILISLSARLYNRTQHSPFVSLISCSHMCLLCFSNSCNTIHFCDYSQEIDMFLLCCRNKVLQTIYPYYIKFFHRICTHFLHICTTLSSSSIVFRNLDTNIHDPWILNLSGM